MKPRRYLCPACGRTVACTGPIYQILRDESGRRLYVYLRAHNAEPGRPCPQATAWHVGTAA